jgi:cytochrome c peroxidase
LKYRPIGLTESDTDDLVAFIASLTSANYKEQGAAKLARQGALSRTTQPQRDTARAFGPKPLRVFVGFARATEPQSKVHSP